MAGAETVSALLLLLVAEVEVRGPTEVAFGKAFELTVIRRWSAGLVPGRWEDGLLEPLAVNLVEVRRAERDGLVEETLRFDAYAFDRDAVVVGGVTFTARAADGTGHSAKTDPLHIIVESSLDAAASGPVEIPGGLMDVPFNWGRWKMEILGGLIVVAGFAWTAMRFRRGRASGAASESVDVRALDRLAAAAALHPEPFYIAVSDAVRDFICERYGVQAPEMTTQEFLASTPVSRAMGERRRDGLAAFLLLCDHVKFGRLPTTAADRSEASAAAERFVRDAALEGQPEGAS